MEPDNLDKYDGKAIAMSFVEQGIPVFAVHGVLNGRCTCGNQACQHKGKHPATPRGFKDATTDSVEIERQFSNKDFNVGIPTGEASQIDVIDGDLYKNSSVFEQLEAKVGFALPKSYKTKTGGGGVHVMFRYTGKIKKCLNGAEDITGLDYKTNGGYIVAPGSRHLSGSKYEAIPEFGAFDFSKLIALPEEFPTLPVSTKSTSSTVASAPQEVKVVDRHLAEGSRNESLTKLAGKIHYAGFSFDEGLSLLNALNFSKCTPPLEAQEVATIWSSISRRPRNSFATASSTLDLRIEFPVPRLSTKVLHGIVGDFVRLFAPHTEASEAALFFQTFVILGNMMANEAHMMIESTVHPPILFAAVVGKSSKGRKGTSFDLAAARIEASGSDYIRENVMSGVSSGEGIANAVRDRVVKMEEVEDSNGFKREVERVVDEGGSPKNRTIVESEFSSLPKVKGRDGNTTSEVVRNAWDGRRLQILNKNTPMRASNARISIIGHITLAELNSIISDTDAHNGFSNRFLWVYTERSKLLPKRSLPNADEVRVLDERLKLILNTATTRSEISISDEAQELWNTEYVRLGSTQYPELLDAVLSRAEPQILRMAMIYALLDLATAIQRVHLEAALAAWDYCERSVFYIYGQRALGDSAERILTYMHSMQPAGVSRTELRNLFGRNKTSAAIDGLMSLLLNLRFVRKEIRATGGRPAEIWHLIEKTTTTETT